MKNIKIKIQQRSVYHKITEVEIEVDADVYEHYRLDNGKWADMGDYLIENEHLWSSELEDSICVEDYVLGNGSDSNNDFTDTNAETETRWVWEEEQAGGHL